ncbi:LacI family DNA-binding transcriptional regulator, partial [uncultured Actinomyces sp.]|uniref:LacI family DNA-binding transcriptional regulator n=1 Tax=uncultured Actinomyces sp. TaxID=249061 RepID=UPI003450DC88
MVVMPRRSISGLPSARRIAIASSWPGSQSRIILVVTRDSFVTVTVDALPCGGLLGATSSPRRGPRGPPRTDGRRTRGRRPDGTEASHRTSPTLGNVSTKDMRIPGALDGRPGPRGRGPPIVAVGTGASTAPDPRQRDAVRLGGGVEACEHRGESRAGNVSLRGPAPLPCRTDRRRGDRRGGSHLKDVAALAGVSLGTASRVLTGHPSTSARSRERVTAA